MIAHTPLIPSLMPQGFYIYLRDLLNIMRLKFGGDVVDVGGMNMEFNQAGYTSLTLSENLTTPLVITLAVSAGLLIILITVDRLLLRS